MIRQILISDRTFFICLFLIGITLPFSIPINSTFIIASILLWIIQGNFQLKLQHIKTNNLLKLFISLYMIYVLGAFYSQDISSTKFALVQKLTILIFPIIIGTCNKLSQAHLFNVMLGFPGGCLSASVLCIFFSFYKYLKHLPLESSVYGGHLETVTFLQNNPHTSDIWSYITYTELVSVLAIHPTYFACYILFSICVLISYLYHVTYINLVLKRIILYSIVFLILFLILLASRVVLIAAFIIFIPFMIPFILRVQLKNKALIVGLVLAILTISIVNIPIINYRFKNQLDTSHLISNPRIIIWKCAMQAIKNNLWRGAGTGDAQNQLDLVYRQVKLDTYVGLDPHNQYLKTWLSIGLPGLSLLIAGFLIPTVIAWKQNNKLYIIFIGIFSICCLTESMLETQKGVVFYAFFNSLFAFHSLKQEP